MQFTRALFHVAAIAALLLTGTGQAGAQATAPAPGSLIQPAGETPVQLTRAQVRIQVLRVKGAEEDLPPIAHVRSTFTLRNPGSASVTQTVQLLLAEAEGAPELEGVLMTLRGRSLPLLIDLVPRPDGAPARLASAEVALPAGRDALLATEYFAQPVTQLPYARFRYLLSTGARWAGAIASVEFTLALPYAANAENVLLAHSSPGGQFIGGQVRWRFEALEPAAGDAFFVTVLSPVVWERIQAARRTAQLRPRSAAAWRALAQAYLSAIYVEGDGPQLGVDFIPLMEEAYRRAQARAPGSASLHAELAQALLRLYPRNLPADVFEKVLAALRAALARDPQDALTQQVIADLRARLTQLGQGSGPEAETARQQLAQLEQLTGGQVTPTPAPTALPTEVPPTTPTEAPPQPEATPTALPPTPAPEIDSATPMATPPTDGALDTPTAEPVAATTPVAEEATPNGALAVTEVAVPTAVVTLPGAREPSDAPAGLSGPAGLLVLALAYLLGGLAVLLVHSILARRDRAKAEAMILTANKDEEDGD
jgi:hypothetical protein